MASEGVAIDAVETELGPKPETPLKVVEQAPYEVPADIHAVIETTLDAEQGLGQVGDALVVFIGSNPFSVTSTGKPVAAAAAGLVLYDPRPVLVSHFE